LSPLLWFYFLLLSYLNNPAKQITDAEIANKWVTTVAERIKLDVLSSNSMRYKRKATPRATVLKTWGKLLQINDIRGLRKSNVTRFLVGIKGRLPERLPPEPHTTG